MHSVALTRDNKILTWGVNDQGALGRATPNEGKMVDLPEGGNGDDDSDSDSDDDDSGLNPSEAEPRQVDPSHFPEGTVFASVHAGDSTTFALTNTGLVYGWGTFRVSLFYCILDSLLTTSGKRWYHWLPQRRPHPGHSNSHPRTQRHHKHCRWYKPRPSTQYQG